MKIKDGFVLREIAGTWIVLPLDAETVNFSGMLTLNNSGVMLWKELEKGCDKEALVSALINEYDVEESQASSDVESFVKKLSDAGCITE